MKDFTVVKLIVVIAVLWCAFSVARLLFIFGYKFVTGAWNEAVPENDPKVLQAFYEGSVPSVEDIPDQLVPEKNSIVQHTGGL